MTSDNFIRIFKLYLFNYSYRFEPYVKTRIVETFAKINSIVNSGSRLISPFLFNFVLEKVINEANIKPQKGLSLHEFSIVGIYRTAND